jgi:hypothetical protein
MGSHSGGVPGLGIAPRSMQPTRPPPVNQGAATAGSWRRGWDSNPRAPLFTGQVDFESTPLRPLRYLSVLLACCCFSPIFEKAHQKVPAFLFQNPRDNLKLVIETPVPRKVIKRPCRAALGIRAPIHQEAHPRLNGCAHAHDARLNSNHQCCVGQTIVSN